MTQSQGLTLQEVRCWHGSSDRLFNLHDQVRPLSMPDAAVLRSYMLLCLLTATVCSNYVAQAMNMRDPSAGPLAGLRLDVSRGLLSAIE